MIPFSNVQITATMKINCMALIVILMELITVLKKCRDSSIVFSRLITCTSIVIFTALPNIKIFLSFLGNSYQNQ